MKFVPVEINKDLKFMTKYLFAGIWNTIFGIALYTIVIMLLGEKHYLFLGLVCNLISITQSYLCYKFLVFKTKGNYLSEYFRCYIVYGFSMFVGLFLMYFFVDIMKISAIISNIIIVCLLTIISFLGHKKYTFMKK